MANYVKFIRGPLAAYNALQTKDNDTLYFITDENDQTLLYVGQNLISDPSNNLSASAKAFLNSLPDDEIELNDGDLQIYVIGDIERIKEDPETHEPLLDPETGEPETEIVQEGHWEIKSINDLVNSFNNEEFESRLLTIEDLLGLDKTQIIEQPKTDTSGNPVYIQKKDSTQDTEELLYWTGLEEVNQTTENTGYPVMIQNLESDDPEYIQASDENNNLLYWNIDENTPTTNEPNGTPAFIQATEEIEVPAENDIEIIKTVLGDVDTAYPQIQQGKIGSLIQKVNDLEDSFQTVTSAISGANQSGIKVVPIGSLNSLNWNLHKYDGTGKDVSSLVDAINTLDDRTNWQSIS